MALSLLGVGLSLCLLGCIVRSCLNFQKQERKKYRLEKFYRTHQPEDEDEDYPEASPDQIRLDVVAEDDERQLDGSIEEDQKRN
mmetsp:Transcript_34947/g.45986  ORF Transcript_34947/g.45986 Transcript_34947/m.45986 type:complete len:84 (+) Transcript_34947:859-1110(+)|eukprot:CAMPEP_0185570138 /NCGR_PEP_ID=MMETSP0434-20130131/2555_1 /TAXON_ID=626734 ORGANISM="Favella taraikaensis, Strain Fe Narragansett Bay" /NCGR_SAMPLE_ID=MMETSP0434 /ASSEMBLY_ACC=CAM_ASM_000379 /LENGTH=83 /DNA_ID=CAMNT_0028185171 /DNA_START=847 /DNA_END=1098 /DNA_ORIENTATION=-